MEGDWVTIDQAAETLGVSPRAVRKYIQAGRLPAYKAPVGRQTLIKPEDLEAFRKPRPIRKREGPEESRWAA